MLSPNQFGYQAKTSCKHAYLVIETIQYFENGAELFHKLNEKIKDIYWRIIVQYYDESGMIVTQLKILSPNFFIDELSQKCVKNGAQI